MKIIVCTFLLFLVSGCVGYRSVTERVRCTGVLSPGVLQRAYTVDLTGKIETKSGTVYKVSAPRFYGQWVSEDMFTKVSCVK